MSVGRARLHVLDVQDFGPAAAGERRLTAATRRIASLGTQAPEADACRPNLLGICAGFVAQLEIRAHDCQA